jgi:secreted PhoX family phosphatase
MTQTTEPTLGDDFDPDDYSSNPSGNADFSAIVSARLSRRSVLAGGMLAAAGFLTSSVAGARPALAAPAGGAGRAGAAGTGSLLGFQPVPLGYGDQIVVPQGYSATPFIPWGTPILGDLPAFVPGTPDAGVPEGNTADQQAQQIGMHHDGMTYFPLRRAEAGNLHGLLVLNHEYTDENYLHTGTSTRPQASAYTRDMVAKSQAAHGVSVVEVRREGRHGNWAVVPSRLNRRITANTPMQFSGPATGNELVRTSADTAGRAPVGTINNCGNGETPWNTYLTCEENFNGYFRVDAGSYSAEDDQLLKRYGVGGNSYNWANHDQRFVVTPDEPHEPNRFGWVVEIDPFDPGSTPVKRTALGRLKHEDATVHVAEDGRVVVYMGDDQRFEYVYKFVSAHPWEAMRRQGRSPLDEGTLYVARFNEDGTGNWLPLVHGAGPLTEGNGFADQGEVLVKTRLAADALGATKMDRPEWTAVDPRTGTVYLTLTNNSQRIEPNAANPRPSNSWGHIIRWDEDGGDHTARSFRWDLLLLAGQGRESGDGSTISEEDAFGSPDGLWIDPDSRAWIQTDGTQPNRANNQMLAADPYRTDETGAPELRRFLTGVRGCEVTGFALPPDRRTMFVNIQHPTGTWPQNDEYGTPRSATVVVTKDDGGVIGT